MARSAEGNCRFAGGVCEMVEVAPDWRRPGPVVRRPMAVYEDGLG
jgi:hypothetical protein